MDKAQRQVSSYIDREVERVLGGLATDALRENYAKAMVMSANLGDLGLASPCHPQQIYQVCRFNEKMQRSYNIVLSKDDALEFLREFCFQEISDTSFKRAHTRATYEELFKRPCLKSGRRSMLCTYAEWLYMHDYRFEPRLPESLIDLLPEGWKAPPGQYQQDDT